MEQDTSVLRSRVGVLEARLNVLAVESETNATDIAVFKKHANENFKVVKWAIVLSTSGLFAACLLLTL